ncbi:MAG: 16S rRNA processing protein RimM [Acidimicrobiales bacterium]|nr:16S rRNA processing protein RimM [Acidimicrobiales bacterium]MCB9394615.1 16S rRNA processing protein RimM [Acidimicrobiaceae bacterium]
MTRPPLEGLLEVGRLGRAHGVKGGVVVTLVTDRLERVAPGARLHDGAGWRTVASSRALPQGKWMVQFDDVADRNEAERLTGRVLWGEPLVDDDALWVHDLIGARVADQTGADRGVCVAVVDNPAHDLLELDTGHLVPVTFVVSVADGQITVDAPDGLFDLLD